MLSLVRAQVADAVLSHAEPVIHAELIRLLGRPGYALHPEGRCRAGVLTLEVYAAIRRRYDRAALVAAAAVELQMQSAYLFDDVADRPGAGSGPEDLALALALLTAGTATATEATRDAPDPWSAMHHFCAATGGACAGQFLDARLEKRGGASLGEALEMTCLKSGSLGSFAAGFAARLAGARGESLALFERVGFNLFTYAQLVDDQRDACAPAGTCDLAQAKATLPVVYFSDRAAIDSARAVDGTIPRPTCDAYESSGASAYAAILALAYLDRAHADLAHLADRGHDTHALGRFLDRVESGASETLGAVGGGVVA